MHLPPDRSTWTQRMLRFGLFVFFLLLGSTMVGEPVHAAPLAPAGTLSTPVEPLAKMLAPDGTLNLPTGFRGSWDAHGWGLASGEGEPPRFAPLKSAASSTLPASTGPLIPLGGAGSAIPQVAGDEKWTGFGLTNGVNGKVTALVTDGSGNLYVAGSFHSVGGVVMSNVAMWNGTTWSALGNGLNAGVNALAWDGPHHLLYAAGNFSSNCANAECSIFGAQLNFVAKWDGTNWSPLGKGVDSSATSLALDDSGSLYVGGPFSTYCAPTCSFTANHIAKWTPSGADGTWSALGSGANVGVNSTIDALAWDGTSGVLYVGGDFTAIANNSVPANHIALFNPSGAIWWPLNFGPDFGVNGSVRALAWDGASDWLYVGGDYDHWCANQNCTSLGAAANHIARFDTADVLGWSGLNYGVDSSVHALLLAGSVVYASGYLRAWCTNQACGGQSPANYIAKWTSTGGGSWSALGSGLDRYANALGLVGGKLFAGGDFWMAGGVFATKIAEWNGTSWSALAAGSGLGDGVAAVAADGSGNVYVGGTFRTVGSLVVNSIARWSASTKSWSALQNGLWGYVSALAIGKDGSLYVGGLYPFLCGDPDCHTMSGPLFNSIAKWTPSGGSGSWSALGYGVKAGVNALVFDQTGFLYAAGDFSGSCLDEYCASTGPANHIARWNGSAWSAVGDGVQGRIGTLAVDKNNTLYAGGWFKNLCGNAECSSPGAQVNYIAKWSSSSGSWSGVGNGVNGDVRAAAVDGNNNFYVGGEFTRVCGSSDCVSLGAQVNYVAEWNASTGWSPLANGLSNSVYGLATGDSNNLYVGGYFRNLCANAACTIPGASVNGVALWNGSTWFALGSGIGPGSGAYITSLAWQPGRLSVGGWFSTAGDKLSANLAQYTYGSYLYLPLVKR